MRPYRFDKSAIILFLRVTPNAGRNEIVGTQMRDDGRAVLRIRVSAVPDKGKANKAVIALLAKNLHLPKSAFSIVSGQTARLKTISITGEREEIAARLEKMLA
ncbi:hypothetical protein MNBD_ALPHA12-729 [hydrothermal vent metagenome]|uniref:COG1872 n=1 Tax=hydrothermal vent metagenome TaxID=652676 RepID=A0A3B0TKA0_9ZZZZ